MLGWEPAGGLRCGLGIRSLNRAEQFYSARGQEARIGTDGGLARPQVPDVKMCARQPGEVLDLSALGCFYQPYSLSSIKALLESDEGKWTSFGTSVTKHGRCQCSMKQTEPGDIPLVYKRGTKLSRNGSHLGPQVTQSSRTPTRISGLLSPGEGGCGEPPRARGALARGEGGLAPTARGRPDSGRNRTPPPGPPRGARPAPPTYGFLVLGTMCGSNAA